MLLRRVIEHLRDQNWTAVGMDFVIVVIGVFVGIQVANWNEALADERLGRAYAARLLADLEKDRATGQALADYYGAVLDSVERGDALLADPQSRAEDLVVHLYRASEIVYSPPSSATWDEVVSAGHTGLLEPGLASHAAAYFAFDTARNVLDTLNRSAYRHRVRALIPLPVQKALRVGCSDVRDALGQIVGFMADCQLAIDAAQIEATAAVLRADPVVQRELRNQYSHVNSAHANLKGRVAVIEKALAAARDPVAAESAAR